MRIVREPGLERLRKTLASFPGDGFVLALNKPLPRLAAGLGFGIAPAPGDRAVRLCRLPLGDS